MSTMSTFDTTVQGAVASVTFATGSIEHTVDGEFVIALGEAVTRAAEDGAVRAVVVRGEGPGFCAGLVPTTVMRDLPVRPDGQPDGALRRDFHRRLELMQAGVRALERVTVPVIVAIAGVCRGAGLAIACAADLRLCTADARFEVGDIEHARVPDLGTLIRLPEMVGRGVARDMVYTGRSMLAPEAERRGLVVEVCAGDGALASRSTAFAAKIAGRAPLAVSGAKALMSAHEGPAMDEALRYEAAYNAAHLVTQDLGMAIAAAVTGEPPEWGGR